MRTIGVVTVGRSDYGNYLPVLRQIQSEPGLELRLIVSGTHLVSEFGSTYRAIEEDGFEIDDRVEMLLSSDAPEGIAKSMGLGIIGFAQSYSACRPDLLLVLGDRFEMYAAVVAALPFKLPIAHIHGGEITQGAMDDALRHSITKLSHLHFVSTEDYRRRVLQLGEESWRITVSGAPGLDNVRSTPILDRRELELLVGMELGKKPLLVTYHPVTLEYEQTESQTVELLAALNRSGLPVVFTMPNADTNGRIITKAIEDYVAGHQDSRLVDNLGNQGYFSLMSLASAMVGNSSSGITEAGYFNLPVVNIGNRQLGRIRTGNIIDVGYSRDEISTGIRQAISKEFRQTAAAVVSPYGDGKAAERIISVLNQCSLDDRLIIKKFVDRPAEGEPSSSPAPGQYPDRQRVPREPVA